MGTNTGLGIGIGIPFKNFSSGGRQPLPPDLKASLKGVWIAYGKSNNDADRSIVKNLVDPDNPFVISNAAYKLNSGYGKYEEDFTTWVGAAISINNGAGFKIEKNNTGWWGFSTYGVKATNEFKIKVTNCRDAFSWRYKDAEGIWQTMNITKDGIYTLPASQERDEHDAPRFFSGNPNATYNGLTVEQIPSYQGAFVTDGINDMITSTKTVQEILGGSNEITVVSMMANLDSRQILCNSNFSNTNGYNVRNTLEPNGVISMLGYTDKNGTTNNLNLIMGDKDSIKLTDKVNFNSDYVFYPAQYYGSYYKAAWYWTVIANKVLTTDEINQVIAYFNLDRTLKPDILCNTIKQGITNENHAEFGDKLIDFSGNGRDIQLNNLAWKLDSGIGKYETDLSDTRIWTRSKEITSSPFSFSYNGLSGWILFANTELTNSTDIPSFKIQIKGLLEGQELIYRYYDSNGQSNVYSMGKDGEYTLPSDVRTAKPQTSNTSGFQVVKNEANIITITQIPSHAGSLCLDGVNDFGQFVGDLGLKDYTLIMNRAYNNLINNQVPLVSSNIVEDQTPFIVEHWNTGSNAISFSYGASRTTDIPLDINKKIVYQSTYSYMGYVIPKGNAISTGNGITLGKFGNGVQYSAICLWSLMLFPYSMSEFLIERQLKKHKLGTLYPNMVEFRPVIKANANYNIFYTALLPLTGFVWEKINIGDYIPVGRRVAIQLSFDNEASELVSAISSQLGNISITKNSNNKGYTIFGDILKNKSPQKINITIDEYIRYEDIKQPYPLLFEFTDENGNLISWGGKAKVGNTITRTKSVSNANILAGLYNTNNYKLNGKPLEGNSYVVEKQMVFTCTATWDFDNNEPKCILSPRLLRIPNSSYKILGHIPDISGHGNHGKINNSAYALASGANGYPYDYKNSSFWSDSVLAKVVSGELIEYFAVKNSTGFSNITSGVYKGEIKVTGVTKAISENKISLLRIYTNSTTDNELIDITQDGNYNIDIKGVGDANRVFFYAIPNNPNESIVVRLTEPIYIEQVGEYEGAYCLDGVDDFVTIPTVTGGKQVLMKVNWQSDVGAVTLYDQRLNISDYEFAIYNGTRDLDDNPVMAYQGRNNGQTYIDGILNSNIMASELKAITHNITITNELSLGINNTYPVIGSTRSNTHFAQMSLYDFMLFDEISTDDKIKELNEYVGIEAKVELPPYYWDAYGKTNLDADKATIQQRGVAVGDYDLTNNNFAYDNMSGFGGYTLGKFTNSWSLSNNSNSISIVARNPYDITLKKLGGNSDWEFNTTELKIISNPVSVKFKSDKNIRFTCDYHYYTVGGNSEGAPLGITSKDLIANEDTIITISPISQENIDKYNIDINRGYYLIYFQLSLTLAVNEEVTIEMLPLYPNGLVYDGITDYSENANIPALDDFTAIIKREWLKKQGCPLIKGSKVYEGGNGNALLLEWDKAYNFVFYKRTDIMEGEVPDNISFITPTNYNGNVITRGSEQDTNGICIAGDGNAGFANMIFYKLILYPKTIPLLQINFLKNLMERDEIIDLTNPIFIKDE